MKKLKFIFGKLSILYYILFFARDLCTLQVRKHQRAEVCIFGFRYPSGTQSLYLDWLPASRKGKSF